MTCPGFPAVTHRSTGGSARASNPEVAGARRAGRGARPAGAGLLRLGAVQVGVQSGQPWGAEGGPVSPVLGVLISRLGVDVGWQGRGLGSALLVDAVVLAERVSAATHAQLLVVKAGAERGDGFFARFGFRPLGSAARWRYLTVRDVRATLRRASGSRALTSRPAIARPRRRVGYRAVGGEVPEAGGRGLTRTVGSAVPGGRSPRLVRSSAADRPPLSTLANGVHAGHRLEPASTVARRACGARTGSSIQLPRLRRSVGESAVSRPPPVRSSSEGALSGLSQPSRDPAHGGHRRSTSASTTAGTCS